VKAKMKNEPKNRPRTLKTTPTGDQRHPTAYENTREYTKTALEKMKKL